MMAGTDFVHLLKESIRQTSRRLNNTFVGQDILAAVMSRNAVMSDDVVAMSTDGKYVSLFTNSDPAPFPDRYKACMFSRFPKDSDGGVYESPHIVAPGFKTAMTLLADDGSAYGIRSLITGVDGAGNVAGFLSPRIERKKPSRGKRRRQSGGTDEPRSFPTKVKAPPPMG
jgi:hypothetical protein